MLGELVSLRMAPIIDYLDKRGFFVSYELPQVLHKVICVTPAGSFSARFLPVQLVNKVGYSRKKYLSTINSALIQVPIHNGLHYLPLESRAAMSRGLESCSTYWDGLVDDLESNWQQLTKAGIAELVDYLVSRWRRSSVRSTTTKTEFLARAISSAEKLAAQGVCHQGFSFTCFLVSEITLHQHLLAQHGYRALPIVLSSWFSRASADAESRVLAWFDKVHLEHKKIQHSERTKLCRRFLPGDSFLDPAVFYAPLRLFGRQPVVQLLADVWRKVQQFKLDYIGQTKTPDGRRAGLALLQDIWETKPRVLKLFETPVCLERLVSE